MIFLKFLVLNIVNLLPKNKIANAYCLLLITSESSKMNHIYIYILYW